MDILKHAVFAAGARVPAAAYAPMTRRLAKDGHFVAILRPPLRISSFDEDLPSEVIAAHPGVETWFLGGHSLGGSSALNYADEHPGLVAGVVLLASRPMGRDLSKSRLPVVSIFGVRPTGAGGEDDPNVHRPHRRRLR